MKAMLGQREIASAEALREWRSGARETGTLHFGCNSSIYRKSCEDITRIMG